MKRIDLKRAAGLLAAAVLLLGTLTACGVPANTVYGVNDLEGKTIACQLGTTGYIYAGNLEDVTVNGYEKGAEAVKALARGKADAVILDREPARILAAADPSLRILDDPFAQEDYAIAYAKTKTVLGQQIDEAISALKADGTLDEITSHWIGDEADGKSYVPDSSVQRSGRIIMATHADFPPYESVEEGEIVGIDVDMMYAICDRLGYELVILDMDFDRIIPALEAGKADVGVAAMTVTEERKERVTFTQSYVFDTQVIIVRAD